ncbi:MAG: LysR family transcriptional regulator [Verrucomicrobiaceae bacterium]
MPFIQPIPDLGGTKGFSIERLLTFCRIVESGGLAKGAKKSGQDLSQTRRQFAEIESFFGRALAERSRRDFRLNEFGNELYQLASGFIHSVAELQNRCADKSPQFNLASGGGLVSWLIFPRMNRLSLAVPNVKFVVKSHRTKDLIDGVICNKIDFGLVRRTAIKDRRLGFKSLGHLDYSLFVSTETAKSHGVNNKSSVVEALSKIPLILIDGDGEFREKIAHDALQKNITLKPLIECGSYTDAAITVAWGGVCSILPTLADQHFQEREFVSLPWPTSSLKREICLVWNNSALRTGGGLKKRLKAELESALRF